MTKFIFDLDGTVTKQETLPLISKHFKIQEEIDNLTMDTIKGNIPFIESFIRRVYILGRLPVSEVADLLADVELYTQISDFIKNHCENCVIATGNLECWVDQLATKVGCCCYSSYGIVENNQIKKLTRILKKENIVSRYKSEGEKTIFIGDGNNDAEAMRLADVSIASGLTHSPAKSVLDVADYVIYDEGALCRQLNQLL